MFLDKVTVKKISILGSSYKKELFECIDKSQVPAFLGGTGPDYSRYFVHPWTEYDNFCIEKKTFFHYPEARISDPWKAAQTLIYDVKQLRSTVYSQNTTAETNYKRELDDDSEFILKDDYDMDEGIDEPKGKMLKVLSFDIKHEGRLMTIPDEELWF